MGKFTRHLGFVLEHPLPLLVALKGHRLTQSSLRQDEHGDGHHPEHPALVHHVYFLAGVIRVKRVSNIEYRIRIRLRQRTAAPRQDVEGKGSLERDQSR